MKLLKVQTIEQALQQATAYFDRIWHRERVDVPIGDACFCRLAEDIYSDEAVPNVTRSTVDGYAVRAKDTQGASDGLPVMLKHCGAVIMGEATTITLQAGETAYVPTGGMLPEGADAMVMVEYCEDYHIGDIAIHRPVASGDHVLRRGSDMAEGDLVLAAGRRLSPYDMAALATVGCHTVPVWLPPKVSVFSSGDEVVPIDRTPAIAQVRDSNGYGVAAQARAHGWAVVRQGHLRDDEDEFFRRIQEAMRDSDMVVVSGGSSKGKKDYTAATFAALGTPGVFTHGLAIKPGKPTILAGAQETLLVGLPGHPVSAMMVFDVLLQGLDAHLYDPVPLISETALLTENINGSPGQVRYIPARLYWESGESRVQPLYGKSGQISLLTKSDVMIVLPMHAEGARARERVAIRRIH